MSLLCAQCTSMFGMWADPRYRNRVRFGSTAAYAVHVLGIIGMFKEDVEDVEASNYIYPAQKAEQDEKSTTPTPSH